MLNICKEFHQQICFFDIVMVMPDHVHLQLMPLEHMTHNEVLRRIKGRSSREINRFLRRRGKFWQRESFDRILRSDEDRMKRAEYIAYNPVRAGLVDRPEDWPWLWIPGTAR